MAATGKVIGTVTAVVGEAKATAADGTIRILQVGDQVRSDEVISTSAAGSINVALESGKTLDCGGDVNLTLHESILGVATAASSQTGASDSDVDAIQRAIAAGQDPSQVAAATAAGGAPAAGGADDGGTHEPVILEQGNSASVVSSGFTTEGETMSFLNGPVQAQLMVASVSLPSSAQDDQPAAHSIEIPSAPSLGAPADDQLIISAIAVEVAQAPATPAIEVASTPAAESNNAPQIVVSAPANTPVEQNPTAEESSAPVALNPNPAVASEDAPSQEPVTVVADTSPDEATGPSEQPVVVVTQPGENPADTSDDESPATPAVNPDPQEQSDEGSQPPVVVVAQPEENPVDTTDDGDTPSIPVVDPSPQEQNDDGSQPPVVVVTQPEEETPAPTDSTPAELPQPPVIANDSLTYSISANTNQDEQLALLTFENGNNTFQGLVFFHQQGQQQPMAVPLEFDLDYGVNSTIKLQYIDAFAGDSDSSTGHTAQKIAIKDFALGEGDTNTLIAQESDGVNVGLVGNTMQSEGTVVVKMNDPSTTADDAAAGPVGDWSYSNPVDVNDRVTYDGNSVNSPQADTNGGFDILDVTTSSLDLGSLADSELENFEVIALKGSSAQTLTLSVEDVLKVTDGADVLHIIGGTETARGNTVHDTLNVQGSGWTVVDGDSSAAGIQPSYFGWVQVTHSTGATLLVDPDVNVHLLG